MAGDFDESVNFHLDRVELWINVNALVLLKGISEDNFKLACDIMAGRETDIDLSMEEAQGLKDEAQIVLTRIDKMIAETAELQNYLDGKSSIENEKGLILPKSLIDELQSQNTPTKEGQ